MYKVYKDPNNVILGLYMNTLSIHALFYNQINH